MFIIRISHFNNFNITFDVKIFSIYLNKRDIKIISKKYTE